MLHVYDTVHEHNHFLCKGIIHVFHGLLDKCGGKGSLHANVYVLHVTSHCT